MSDVSNPTHDTPPEGALVQPSAIPDSGANSPPNSPPAGESAEIDNVLTVIRRGLAPDADAAAQAMARDICARIAQLPPQPVAVALPTAPQPSSFGIGAAIPRMPESPLTTATRALRELPPEQLLDMVLQRLRAALPTGAAVPAPKGIQFPLVPMPPPDRR